MTDHILIVGLGSIGRRHLRHFRSLGVKRIDALRSGKATLLDDGQPQPDNTYAYVEDALAQNPAAVIVCTPSSLHTSYVLAAVKRQIPVLCEKPLTHSYDEAIQIEAAAGNTPVYIAHNLRFHKGFAWIKEQIEQNTFGTPLMAQAHFGAYLPDWHPWEDYKESYAAKKDLGGGAALTHTHEPDYLSWLFGGIVSSYGFKGNMQSLGTDVDEQSCIILKHAGGMISSISLSINQKPAQRCLHVQFDQGTLNFDLLKCTISFTKHDGSVNNYDLLKDYNVDETYCLQAKAFLNAIETRAQTALCTLKEGMILVQTATNIY